MSETLLLGVPKGSLEAPTLNLFARAGFSFQGSGRSLWLSSSDAEIAPVLLKPQEIPRFVASGSLDCGITGFDWICETNVDEDIRVLADLPYSKRSRKPVQWVLAVSKDSDFQSLDDFKSTRTRPVRVSTELKHIVDEWLAERGIIAEVAFSWGATEAKVPVFADAIVECTETGESLEANNLRVLDVVLESSPKFFANRLLYRSDTWKRAKIDGISILLESCLAADTRVTVHVVVPSHDVENVKALLPSSAQYSVINSEANEVLFDIVLNKDALPHLIPQLARNGVTQVTVQNPVLLYR